MLLQPNAKINIGLNIVRKRADGYHDLETIFYPISLCDRIEISRTTEHNDLRFHSGEGIVLDCSDENNLIVKTYRIFKKQYGIGGVDISFEKHIPFGAGLGGGSSDAAHTAIALNQLFDLQLSSDELQQTVRQLGADCPFFIINKPCFAQGIGDILQPIDVDLHKYELLLIKPDIHVSTRDAYSHVLPQQPQTSLTELIELPVNKWKDHIRNDFEESVFQRFPQLSVIKQVLYEYGAEYASMSGSGSSFYGLFRRGSLKQLQAEGGTDIKLRLKNENLAAMVFFDNTFGER